MRIKFSYYLILFTLFSCSNRNLAYFSDLKQIPEYEEKIVNLPEPKIQTDDLLSVTISSLSADAGALFSRGTIAQVSNPSTTGIPSNKPGGELGYLVDQAGYIDFPVLGKIKLGGLTKQEATELIVTKLQDYVKQPTASIRFINFRVTVVGEVSRPSTFVIPSERLNVLEALGMAGDMTPYGRRDNVLIIREENGIRKMARLDLNSRGTFSSPYFYLQQNDVVYVEPNKSKVTQSTFDTRFISLSLAAMSTLSIILWRLL
ncbi:polysaccharide biosynthesis/export family protein [Pontibacter sp. BT731]|uniref:polysaccharide biosynthesis/export family protein n=1 Tax=Pontibacter coccineus TaxID=3063328 RepID=UPI0026E23A57|nr:polysaccharide biosynthesis/export family protein [Pontibacter sp. BT731]MDO6390993.1 polysaccharide biosynthesis/export family protein [Pontibacter sp. BT731]